MPAEGRGRGGAVVVLRGRESRSHGEGRQRVSQGEDCNGRRHAGEHRRRDRLARPGVGGGRGTKRRMQLKLHRWAGEDPARKFGDLFNLVCDPAFLVHAWQRVAGNTGARTPGVDRATVAAVVTTVGVLKFLHDIRAQLKAGTFRPVEGACRTLCVSA